MAVEVKNDKVSHNDQWAVDIKNRPAGSAEVCKNARNPAMMSEIREEPWTDDIEKHLTEIAKTCALKRDVHKAAGYYFDSLRRWIGLPAIIIPVVGIIISNMVGWGVGDTCETVSVSDYLFNIFLLISSVLAGIMQLFNPVGNASAHFMQHVLYDSINARIGATLIRQKEFRIVADVFLTEITRDFGNLCRTDPVVPEAILVKFGIMPTNRDHQTIIWHTKVADV